MISVRRRPFILQQTITALLLLLLPSLSQADSEKRKHASSLWATEDLIEDNSGWNPALPDAFAVARNANRMVMAGSYITVWDPLKGEQIYALKTPEEKIVTVALSNDGRILASGGLDEKIRLRDLTSKRILKVLKGHDGPVMKLAISDDATTVASSSSDRTIRIWDVETGTARHVIHTDAVKALAFDRSGKFLISGHVAADQTLRLWDVATGEEVRRFNIRTFVLSIAVSLDGQRIAVSGEGKSIYWINFSNGNIIHTFQSTEAGSPSIALSNDGQYVATLGNDKIVSIWNLKTFEPVWQQQDPGIIPDWGAMQVFFTQNSRSFITADRSVAARLWSMKNGMPVARFYQFKAAHWLTLTEDGYYNANPRLFTPYSSLNPDMDAWDIESRLGGFLTTKNCPLKYDASRVEQIILTGGKP